MIDQADIMESTSLSRNHSDIPYSERRLTRKAQLAMSVSELAQRDLNGSPSPGYNWSQRIPPAQVSLQQWIALLASSTTVQFIHLSLSPLTQAQHSPWILLSSSPIPPSSLCSFPSLLCLDHILQTKNPFRASHALGRHHRLTPSGFVFENLLGVKRSQIKEKE